MINETSPTPTTTAARIKKDERERMKNNPVKQNISFLSVRSIF